MEDEDKGGGGGEQFVPFEFVISCLKETQPSCLHVTVQGIT